MAQVQELPIVGQIGGAAFAVALSEERIYMAEGSQLKVLDISSPTDPVELGRIYVAGIVQDIELVGTRAYLAVGPDTGMRIVDVSDATNMSIIGEHNFSGALDLLIVNDIVFLAGSGGISVFDVAIAAEIRKLAFEPNPVNSIAMANSILFAGGELGITAYDASPPEELQEIGSIATSGHFFDMQISGELLFSTDTEYGFRVWDIANPAVPNLIGSGPFIDFAGYSIGLENNIAFVVGFGLHLFDVSDPTSPVKLANAVTRDNGDIVVANGYAYVGDSAIGLRVFDVSAPNAPVQIGIDETRGGYKDIAMLGNRAFAATAAGLAVLDVTNPRVPQPLSYYNDAGTGDISVRGQTVMASRATDVHFLDVTDPFSIASLSVLTLSGAGSAVNFEFGHGYALVPRGIEGMKVVDVSNLTTPMEIGELPFECDMTDVVSRGSLAFGADQTIGLRVLDIQDPASPVELSSLTLPGGASLVAVEESYCYLASQNTLRIVDVSNPGSPVEIGSLALSQSIGSLAVSDEVAYLSLGQAGLTLVNVANPSDPTSIARVDTPGVTSDAFPGNFAFIADGDNGLVVVAIPPPAPELDPAPRFINADELNLMGTVQQDGSFVSAGGGVEPRFQQLGATDAEFTITVELRQEAVNNLSVTTINELGLVSLPAIARVVEGPVFPSTPESVTALAITPDPAPAVALNDSLAFTCTATFSDASMADVTEFVTWEATNGEVVTDGGLYVNTKTGAAQVRAFVAGTFSNSVIVGDIS